jgi:hypothetical protein
MVAVHRAVNLEDGAALDREWRPRTTSPATPLGVSSSSPIPPTLGSIYLWQITGERAGL